MVVGLALLCCLLWGSAVPMVKVGFGVFGLDPSSTPSLMFFAGSRFTLSGLILIAIAAMTQRWVWPSPRRLGQLTLLGLLSTTGQYGLFYVGLAHTTGVKASIGSATSTFFSVLIAHFLYRSDRLTGRRLLGCAIGFAGVVAVNLAPTGLDLHVSLIGDGFIVLAAVLFSIASIYGKGLSRSMDASLMTGWQLLIGGLVLGAGGALGGGRFGNIGVGSVLLLGYLAALSACAFALWALLLKHNPVGTIAIFNCASPIFGVAFSGLILGEPIFEWKNLAALVLVSAGIWLVTSLSPRDRLEADQTAPG